MSNNFAVVDCETTGLGTKDRIIEIAVVVLDGQSLETVDELDTLINPMRDVGKTDLHGVTANMVSAAPIMDEVIGGLARRINGAVLVAHNLTFDSRMIANECHRLNVGFNRGVGVCTLKLTGERLDRAAERHHIPLIAHHRALADARVSAELLRLEIAEIGVISPAEMLTSGYPVSSRTLRRDAADTTVITPLNRLLSHACYPSSIAACLDYFDLLDWVLDDAVISSEEQTHLDDVIRELNLSGSQVQAMHESYISSLIAAVERDQAVSTVERQLLTRIASALNLPDYELPNITKLPSAGDLIPGLRVCFTGSAQDDNGSFIEREELEEMAAKHGMQPVSGVTKSKCDLLVAADPASNSGKGMKARDYGIPVMSVSEFVRRLG